MFIGKEVSPDFGPRIQRGAGIGGIFSKFVNFLKPGIKKLGKVVKKIATSEPVKKIAKETLKTTVNAGSNILGDIILGEDPSEAAQNELERVRQNVGSAVKSLPMYSEEGSRKRKKAPKNLKNKKKKRTLLD